MRQRIARTIPWGIGLLALVQIMLAVSFVIVQGDYAMAIGYLGAGFCALGWAFSLHTVNALQGNLDAWKETATDWKNIAEDRRSNARWHR